MSPFLFSSPSSLFLPFPGFSPPRPYERLADRALPSARPALVRVTPAWPVLVRVWSAGVGQGHPGRCRTGSSRPGLVWVVRVWSQPGRPVVDRVAFWPLWPLGLPKEAGRPRVAGPHCTWSGGHLWSGRSTDQSSKLPTVDSTRSAGRGQGRLLAIFGGLIGRGRLPWLAERDRDGGRRTVSRSGGVGRLIKGRKVQA